MDANDSVVIEPQDMPTLQESRIRRYEAHGWWTIAVWFPLGFALLATQRYYKVNWYSMYHLHNALGLIVVGVTLYSCLDVYAFANWE